MREPITKSDWIGWKQHPVTRAFIHDINALREVYKEQWSEGRFGDDDEKMYRGMCQAIRDLMEYALTDFDVIEDETPDEENQTDVEPD